ncbi:putative hemolysin [Pantoea stewartii]|uniref:Hemolysin n=1 Tax=Pantoea stewartii subsp. stewartii DC283 TaxID=660596 RepID=H3RF66_PANSE|nr:DUF333 domain-containing protein [Pantoea stewartii]ARF51977.1 hemolysin [Pantoea stewartii subsp. stewartii DC283]EHT99908.1 hypothetical protein CKS_1993 [Pantoea stewartii subsp. stewartii DC283]KAB0546604.1 DUF333 domain-containing protein [Pantoea stewartii subsp. stewartii]
MKTLLLISATALLAGCSPLKVQQHQTGMANPASVYCEKIGGKLDIVKEPGGEVGYCTLPSGERIEEWTLFRKDGK